MNYYLFKAVLDVFPKIEISKNRYLSILESWRSIFHIVSIEEQWDNIVQSFLELERDLLFTALDEMVLDQNDYTWFHQNRLLFARRLSNLLHAARCYLDHTPRHLKNLPLSDVVTNFREYTGAAYAGHPSYRFMEALRNYAQHRGVPLHGTTYDRSWVEYEGKGKGLMRHLVSAAIHLDEIRSDGTFKRSVLDEFDSDLEKLDVATITREYVEALNEVHLALRTTLRPALNDWLRTVREAIELYEAEGKSDVLALAIGVFENEHVALERTYIHRDLLERAEWLIRRNGPLVNLRRRFVTNAAI